MNEKEPKLCIPTILRLPQVVKITGLSSGTIRRLEKSGKFPSRRKIADRLVAWLARDIQQWIENAPVITGNSTGEQS